MVLFVSTITLVFQHSKKNIYITKEIKILQDETVDKQCKVYCLSRTIQYVYLVELSLTKLICTSDELLNIVFITNV